MKIKINPLLLAIFLAIMATGNVSGTDTYLSQPGLFKIKIPSGWIYQVTESDENILVFYGPKSEQLLYIEYFGKIKDETSLDFGKRVIKHYNADYGLVNFEMLRELELVDLSGKMVASVVYSYKGHAKLVEYRYFVVFRGQGLTITYSDLATNYPQNTDGLNFVLENWSWAEVNSL